MARKKKSRVLRFLVFDINSIIASIALIVTIVVSCQNSKESDHNKFDQTFFNLLNYHNTVKTSLSDTAYNGKPYLDQEFDRLRNSYDMTESVDIDRTAKDYLMSMQTWYFYEYNRELNPYFSSLYVVLNFADKSKLIAEQERDFYFTTVLGQMTRSEKVLLYYHISLFKDSNEKTLFEIGLADIESRRKLLSTLLTTDFSWLYFDPARDSNLLVYSGVYQKEMMIGDNWYTPPD